jgi:hypothetical protein
LNYFNDKIRKYKIAKQSIQNQKEKDLYGKQQFKNYNKIDLYEKYHTDSKKNVQEDSLDRLRKFCEMKDVKVERVRGSREKRMRTLESHFSEKKTHTMNSSSSFKTLKITRNGRQMNMAENKLFNP